MVEEVIANRRSIRRFSNKKIDSNILKEIVKCGRLYPSRGNKQPLKFILVDKKEICNQIFEK